jgi:hypothetical protein
MACVPTSIEHLTAFVMAEVYAINYDFMHRLISNQGYVDRHRNVWPVTSVKRRIIKEQAGDLVRESLVRTRTSTGFDRQSARGHSGTREVADLCSGR